MNKLLEPLRDYIAPPPAALPPEILPWERDTDWNMDHAARVTLGLLLDDDRSSEMLLAAADYLLAFCNEGYGAHVFPDALLLNGTALALCGYLVDHPEASLWRLTGSARLATEAHERKAALSDTMLARCLLAVCQVADELERASAGGPDYPARAHVGPSVGSFPCGAPASDRS